MEPERDIEKQLRDFAEKRRDDAGAPLELHPATRRLLQSEVARRAKPRRRRSFYSRLAVLRPRLAFSAGFLCLLIVVAGVILHSRSAKKIELAADNRETRSAAIETGEVPPASATATSANSSFAPLSGQEIDMLTDTGMISPRGLQPPPAEAPSAAPAAPSRAETAAGFGGGNVASSEFATSTPGPNPLAGAAATPPANSPSLAASGGNLALLDKKDEPGDLGDNLNGSDKLLVQPPTLHFPAEPAQTESAGKVRINGLGLSGAPGAPPGAAGAVEQDFVKAGSVLKDRSYDRPRPAASDVSPAVLAAFKLEQNGPELQVVDGDGSVYKGSLQLANEASSLTEAESRTRAFAKKDAAKNQDFSWQNYSFRVSGTNRSLKQNVVFHGNLVTLPQGPPVSEWTNLAAVINAKATDAVQSPGISKMQKLPLANSRISGTAVLENNKEIPIDAVSAKN